MYKKEDVVWFPVRQLSMLIKRPNDPGINIHVYRSQYALQQGAKPIPHSHL